MIWASLPSGARAAAASSRIVRSRFRSRNGRNRPGAGHRDPCSPARCRRRASFPWRPRPALPAWLPRSAVQIPVTAIARSRRRRPTARKRSRNSSSVPSPKGGQKMGMLTDRPGPIHRPAGGARPVVWTTRPGDAFIRLQAPQTLEGRWPDRRPGAGRRSQRGHKATGRRSGSVWRGLQCSISLSECSTECRKAAQFIRAATPFGMLAAAAGLAPGVRATHADDPGVVPFFWYRLRPGSGDTVPRPATRDR